MREKIRIPINNIILKKDDIIGLAKCLEEQGETKRIYYTIKFTNDQEIAGDNIGIFENDKFNEYEIQEIYMSFHDKEYVKKIEVWIENNSDRFRDSYIIVSYENEEEMDWLAITEKKIKERLSYCEKRGKMVSILQNEILLFGIIVVLIIIPLIVLVTIVLKSLSIRLEVTYGLALLFGICISWISFGLRGLFLKAFPKVEIDIQEKNNGAKRTRNKLKFISLTFIIPLILDIIYGIVENVFHIS